MKSPFPGMDPYLEQHWRDVHADLVATTRRALNQQLPGDLVARMEERVVIDEVGGGGHQRVVYPDVRVYEDGGRQPAPATGGATAEVATPILLETIAEEHTETYITIVEAGGGQLITVLEYLSPSNKLAGEGREEYRRKRRDLERAGVNVVEIDLVRAGSWRELLAPVAAPAGVATTYRAFVRSAREPRKVALYPISLRATLPRLPVPLRASDADVVLDLQRIFEDVYAGGRYDRTDYSHPCDPPLDGDDAAWAGALLRTHVAR